MAFLLTASHSVCRGALSEQRLSATIQKKVALGYLRFLPDDDGAATNRTWPLLLFLHGSGARGSAS
jgi:predicted peptidase